LPDGEYDFVGRKVLVKCGRVLLPDGTIAGSVLLFNRGVRNMWRASALPIHEVVRMASSAPASLLNLSRVGELSVGYDADIVLFDSDLRVVRTFVGGHTVFEA
jgi:N-acetylglucosamine-6-phosphate deacetylase